MPGGETSLQPTTEIARRLVDQRTGKPSTLYRTDLSQKLPLSFMDFQKTCEQQLSFSGERPQQIVFLPQLALEMLKGTAALANLRGMELGGYLYGIRFPRTANNIQALAVAFPAAAMDYGQASVAVTNMDWNLAERNALVLAKQTNLEPFLSQMTSITSDRPRPSGQPLAEFHIHHTSLSRNFWGTPSGTPGGGGDYGRIEGLLTTGSLRHRTEPYVWGVITLEDNQLRYTVTSSYKDSAGKVIHKKLPIIEEH